MAITLSNLKAYKNKTRRRLGRGDGSGRGTYSTRGLKGQRSRSGGRKNLKRRGLKQFLQQIPKSRGFKSHYKPFEEVNIGLLSDKFEAGELVSPVKLLKSGLIKTTAEGVKILGQGKLSKKFTVQAHSFSKNAKDAITKAGGSVQVLQMGRPKKENKKNKK